jgi:hypothetical protein
MSDIIALARKHRSLNLRTHYEGCEADHIECIVVKLADEVERLQAEVKRLNQAHQTACEGGELLRVEIERQNHVIDKLVKEIEENGSSPCMGHLR